MKIDESGKHEDYSKKPQGESEINPELIESAHLISSFGKPIIEKTAQRSDLNLLQKVDDLSLNQPLLHENFDKNIFMERLKKRSDLADVLSSCNPSFLNGRDAYSFKTLELSPELIERLGGKDKKNELVRKFEEVIELSPGGRLNKIADTNPKEYNRRLKNEWLCKPPLTGICTGLALEFLLNYEIGRGEIPKMEPSSDARYFERILIPVLIEICNEEGITLEEVKGAELLGRVYDKMALIIKKETGLEVDYPVKNENLDNLLSKLDNIRDGHHALLLEDPNGEVAANHTVYFNKEKGIIADGASGAVINVGAGEDFSAVLTLYIKENYKRTPFKEFSIIRVEKPEKATLRRPSKARKFKLRTMILGLSLIFKVKQMFASLTRSRQSVSTHSTQHISGDEQHKHQMQLRREQKNNEL